MITRNQANLKEAMMSNEGKGFLGTGQANIINKRSTSLAQSTIQCLWLDTETRCAQAALAVNL